jgi:hypothetical protein
MTWSWTLFLTSSLAATVAGLLINKVRDGLARDRKAAGVLNGMLLEISYAKECADEYLTKSANKPFAPAWRLATEFYTTGLAWLATERVIELGDIQSIHRLYVSISEVNRCLDLVEEYRHVTVRSGTESDSPELTRAANETNRLRTKCNHVLERLPAAKEAVERRLTELSWLDFRG